MEGTKYFSISNYWGCLLFLTIILSQKMSLNFYYSTFNNSYSLNHYSANYYVFCRSLWNQFKRGKNEFREYISESLIPPSLIIHSAFLGVYSSTGGFPLIEFPLTHSPSSSLRRLTVHPSPIVDLIYQSYDKK